MNKFYLQSKVRSTGTAYLFYFFLFGTHYAYLNKWGWQLLFWFTLGGFGLWAFFDLFTMNGKVNRYNSLLFQQIEDIEKKEREAEHARNLSMIAMAKGNG